jgi:hypothetical protein
MLETFILLLMGHALADFALQSDAMAKGKNRHHKTTPPPGAVYQATWFYWLPAHALIHGGVVYIITGSIWLGVAETMVHGLVDFAKCENWTGIHRDQTAHILSKVAWALLA